MLYKIIKVGLLFILFLAACQNVLLLTPNEANGVAKITALYPVKYGYGKTNIASTNGIYTQFYITLNYLEEIESSNQTERIASNSALLFYRDLKEERKKYKDVKINIGYKNNTKKSFVYDFTQLESVEKKLYLLENTINAIKANSFTELEKNYAIETPLVQERRDKVINVFNNYKSELGAIKEYKIIGFGKSPTPEGLTGEILHLQAVLIREKQNQAFSIDIFADTLKKGIVSLQFSL